MLRAVYKWNEDPKFLFIIQLFLIRYDTAVLTACLALPEYRDVFSLNNDANGVAASVASLSASFLVSLVS